MADQIKVIPVLPIAWWAQIHMKELYKGPFEIPNPENPNMERRVPRVGWWVVDENGFYRVNAVRADNTSELSPFYPGQGEEYANIITGPAVHQYTTPFRLMVDPTTTPVRFRVDDAMLFYGSEPQFYKVFKGTDITVNGKVISTSVNGSGQPTNANLVLEKVQNANSTNKEVKVARGGHLLELVADQEMVTVVAYRADGLQADYRPAVVCYTTNMAPLDQAKKTILSIALESHLLSQDNPRLLEVPVNMLLTSTAIMGVVTYNDGTIKRLPINGEKFTLVNYKEIVSTTAGAMFDLGLRYTLADDEAAWDAVGNIPVPAITEIYKLRSINPDGNYTAKLFVIPSWNNTTGEYELKWLMYNMERKYVFDVTGKVEITPGYSFNGKLYATKQTLRVAIEMSDVDPYFVHYRHVQDVKITLLAPGTSPSQPTYYRVEYDDQYVFGNGIRIDVTNSTTQVGSFNLNLTNGCTTVDEWLNKVYYPTVPLYYTSAENLPPNPTEFTLRNVTGTWQRVVNIDDVLTSVMDVNLAIKQGDTFVLEFGARSDTDLLQLSAGSMVANIYQGP